MIKTRLGRDKFIDGLVITFLAAACAAVIALNIGLSVSPGKLLPTSISMRTAEMNENIIAALDTAEADIDNIKAGMEPAEAWSLISDKNLDIFFLLALILPEGITKAVLTVGYFARFGLAAAMMYAFCCRHTGLRRLYSFLLGMMYALSAQVILTAQFAPVMNMVILLPAALSAFDTYLRERTWKSFALSSLACALTAISGSCGCLAGIPFLVLATLVLSVGLYSSKRKIFSSWLKVLAAIATGAAMASFAVIPRFITMVPKFDVVQAFKSAEMKYKLYDLLRHMYVAQSGGLDRDMVPAFYIGILTIEAFVLFWANFNIPTRVKVTAALILSVWYISCASSFVSGAVSIFGETAVLSAARLICLEVLIFFYAAVALRNIRGVSAGALYGAFLAPMAFLVFSGNFYSDIKFSTTINLGTAIAMLVCGLGIIRLSTKPTGKKAKMVIAAVWALAVVVNASFIMFNNTVSASEAGMNMTPVTEEDESENFDVEEVGEEGDEEENEGLSVFSGDGRYLLLSENINGYKASSFIDEFNHMSKLAKAGECFEPYNIKLIYSDQAEHKENDVYSVGKGFSSIDYEVPCEKGDRLFVYNGFKGDITLRNTNGEFEEEKDLTGPALCELNASEGKHDLNIFFDLEDKTEARLAILKVRSEAAERLDKMTGVINGKAFNFGISEIPAGSRGTLSFITSVPYDSTVRITVNGKNCKTFEYMGLTGCVFEASENTLAYAVKIGKTVPGLTGGITISAAVCLALIAIPLIYKYTYKNNKKGKGPEGEESPEQPEEYAE